MSFEKKMPISPIQVSLICDCGAEMELVNNNDLVYCPEVLKKYDYKCPKCGAKETKNCIYPTFQYVVGTPLSALGLSWKTYSKLIRLGYTTVEKIAEEIDDIDLPAIAFHEIKSALDERR